MEIPALNLVQENSCELLEQLIICVDIIGINTRGSAYLLLNTMEIFAMPTAKKQL